MTCYTERAGEELRRANKYVDASTTDDARRQGEAKWCVSVRNDRKPSAFNDERRQDKANASVCGLRVISACAVRVPPAQMNVSALCV